MGGHLDGFINYLVFPSLLSLICYDFSGDNIKLSVEKNCNLKG